MSDTVERKRGPRVLRGLRLAAATAALALLAASVPAGAAEQNLTEALATTYRTNPTLAAARAELRAVNEQVPQALSNWRPRVTLQGDVGEQYIDSFGSDGETTTPRSVELDVTQPLYRGGRTEAETKRAEALVRAQRAVLHDVEQQVLLSASIAYMDVWRDQSVLELTINNEQVLARQLEASQDRFEVGEVTRTDVAQSESRLARATSERIEAEGNLSISRAIYQEVVGIFPGVLEAPPRVENLPESVLALTAMAQERNPLVVSSSFTEKSERANIRLQIGELLPELSLVGTLSHSEDTTSRTSETQRGQILARLSVPIYQQGFVSSQIREAKQRRSQRLLETDEARRRAVQDSTSAWEALQTARAEITSFESEVRSTEIALEGVRQENAVGARTVLDILDAEQEFLDAQVNLVTARRDEIVASYQVLTAMGQMTAQSLDLPVEIYDPAADLEKVRDRWWGFGGFRPEPE